LLVGDRGTRTGEPHLLIMRLGERHAVERATNHMINRVWEG
jgi:hypothetical protein